MRKRLAFGIHHARAQGFTPPGVTAPTAQLTGTPSTAGSAPATQQAAPTTAPEVTPAATTPAAAATTAPTTPEDKNTKKNTDVSTTAATATTTQVAAANTSTTPIRTAAASTAPTTPPPAAATSDNVNSVAAVNPNSSQAQQPTVTRVTMTASRSANPSSSALPSASAAADSGPGVGSIAGYAAAALVGIAVISVFAVWMIRRKRRREQDADLDAAPFNRQSWLRNSTILHDDVPTPAAGNFPPPRRDPEMIDRSFNATPVTNYAGMNQYPQNNFGYATQPSYQPGAVIFSPSSANSTFGPGGGPATSLPFSPVYDPTTPNPFEQQAGYTEVTRGGPPSPFNPYHQQQQFEDIQRQMTPVAEHANLPTPVEDRPLPRAPSPRVEAAPPMLPPVSTDAVDNADTFGRVSAYPELSPAPTSAHGHVVEVRASTYEGQATPVQYGFTEGPQASTPVTIAAPQPPAALQAAAGRTLIRPETVYDTEDAYGGI